MPLHEELSLANLIFASPFHELTKTTTTTKLESSGDRNGDGTHAVKTYCMMPPFYSVQQPNHLVLVQGILE